MSFQNIDDAADDEMPPLRAPLLRKDADDYELKYYADDETLMMMTRQIFHYAADDKDAADELMLMRDIDDDITPDIILDEDELQLMMIIFDDDVLPIRQLIISLMLMRRADDFSTLRPWCRADTIISPMMSRELKYDTPIDHWLSPIDDDELT